MKEKPEFIGRHYEDEEKSKLERVLYSWSGKELQPVEGELEKTGEDIKIIKATNALIGNELRSLGIENYQPISLEKIHILPDEIFEKKFPDFGGVAFFSSTSDVVYVNKDRIDTKARFFSTLLHELIHRASTRKFYADKGGGVYDARVGFRVRSPWKGSNKEDRLLGFNELMDDCTVYKIFIENQDSLKELGISKTDIQGAVFSYTNYSPILESIIKKVANNKNISPAKVFEDFERGQFENSILVLKDVEKAFGKGALDILSLLGTLKNQEDNNQLEELIKQFFAEEDNSRRLEIQQRIRQLIQEL